MTPDKDFQANLFIKLFATYPEYNTIVTFAKYVNPAPHVMHNFQLTKLPGMLALFGSDNVGGTE